MYLFLLYIFVYHNVVNGVELWDLSRRGVHDRAADTARLIRFVNKIHDFEKKYSSESSNDSSDQDSEVEFKSMKLLQKNYDISRKFNEMVDEAHVQYISNPEVLETYKNLPKNEETSFHRGDTSAEVDTSDKNSSNTDHSDSDDDHDEKLVRDERRNFATEQVAEDADNSRNNVEDVADDTLKSMELFDLVKPIVKKILTKYKVKIGPEEGTDKGNIEIGPIIDSENTNAEEFWQAETKPDTIVKEEKQRKSVRSKKSKHVKKLSLNTKEKNRQNGADSKHFIHLNKSENIEGSRLNKKYKKKRRVTSKKTENEEESNSNKINSQIMMDQQVIDWADYDEDGHVPETINENSNKNRNKLGIKSDNRNKKHSPKKNIDKSRNEKDDRWTRNSDDEFYKGDDNWKEKKKKWTTAVDDKNINENKDNGIKQTRFNLKRNSEQDSYESFRSVGGKKHSHERDNTERAKRKEPLDIKDLIIQSWDSVPPNVHDFYGKARKRGRISAFKTSIPYGIDLY